MTQAGPAALTNEEVGRYSRHLIMPEVGMEGQLKFSSVVYLERGRIVRRRRLTFFNFSESRGKPNREISRIIINL